MDDLQDVYGARIRGIYERAEKRILEEVRRRVARGIVTPGWAEQKAAEIASLRAWLKRQLPGLLVDVPAELQNLVGQAYDQGGGEAGQQLIEANLLNPAPQAYARGASIRAIANEAAGNITATHPRILRSTVDAYRDVMTGAAEDVLAGVETRWTATRRALNQFADRGITGFIDKAGRSWDLGSYADMATRSAVIRASVAGKADKYIAAGLDLVMVSDHWEECELCRRWESVVLSLTGNTPGYPTLAQAIAEGLFHPNCRHTISLYTPGLSKVPPRQGPADAVEAQKVYAERLQQRRLERGVRQWKRREMAAIVPADLRQAHAKVAEWNKALSDHIEAVNARRTELGIPDMIRQPKREQVVWAPDAVRSAREAAGSRRSFAAAQKKLPMRIIKTPDWVGDLDLPEEMQKDLGGALKAIDKAHSAPQNVKPVRVQTLQHEDPEVLGSYSPVRNTIELRERAPQPITTAVHEIGHYMDFQDLGGEPGKSSCYEFEEWKQAILASARVRMIARFLWAGSPDLQDFAAYLLEPAELWARSYTQYVAQRSGNRELAQAMVEYSRGGVLSTQWEDKDFAPIAKAIENVLRKHGLYVEPKPRAK